MQNNDSINGELAALAAGMSAWYRAAFKAGRERTKGLESMLTAFLAGAVWARRWEQSGAPEPEPEAIAERVARSVKAPAPAGNGKLTDAGGKP